MKLSEININNIFTLKSAKELLHKLLNHLEEAFQTIDNQKQEISTLKEEIARLNKQSKKPSFPSSTSKKSQGFSLTSFLKEKGTWHKHSKTIPIDKDIQLAEVEACTCGSYNFRILRTFTKIIQGIIFIRNNIAYHGREKECLHCGKHYKSILPKELFGVSFDSGLCSFISYLKFGCRMTYPLIHRMLSGIGVQISNGQINEILHKNSNLLAPVFRQLRTIGFAVSSYLQSDATGAKRFIRITKKMRNQYVQLVRNQFLSVFFITPRYNAKTLQRCLGKNGSDKPFVSDDGSPNGECLKCQGKQLCWVHEIRHYWNLFPYFNPNRELERMILTQWKQFYHLCKQYGNAPPVNHKILRETILTQFDQITSQVTGYDLLDKQLRLTSRKKDRLLYFLDHPFVPIHNNACEQDLRAFVILRKISGATKSYWGDLSIARHLSVIQTAQKQGLDVYQTLHGLLTGQLSPDVLTAKIT